ncbi:MAG TPA: tetratricopeptide repeat protein [Euzebya sp.]|nr:tetratricopeptide repeat protein [Euzebya sp.]
MIAEDTLTRARTALAGGDPDLALALAHEALETAPDDPGSLEVAVEAALEVLDEEVVDLARRHVAVTDTAAAHRSLGLALLAEGDVTGAETALRAALRIDPHDAPAVVSLGHLIRMHGDTREATELLERAAVDNPDSPATIRNLIDVHRQAGRTRRAIDWAERLVVLVPTDPLALLDLAELSLELNEHDTALDAFTRLREVDTEPGHRVFPWHGMIEVQIRAGELRAALDLAVSAAGVDREPLTTDALAYVVAQVFGPGQRPAPTREALMAAFAADRARYRHALDESGVI